jgi:hypothetical protein
VSGQRAENRARLMRKFPLWSIQPVTGGAGWTAHRPEFPNVWAVSLADLETQLSEIEGRGRPAGRITS